MTGLVPALAARVLRTRWLVRAPIGVYRAGFGFVFGRRLLMLEHLGRKSGRSRYVVLEVVDRPAPREYVVVAGFGPRAQWYRNVLAEPRVRVSTGRAARVRARAAPMSETESVRSLQRYAQRHPKAWTTLKTVIEDLTDDDAAVPPMVVLTLE